ncbi:MAG: phosphatidate cytidylyltransferase [Limnobacter sp.]|nr:phosphatidate cytidylyltransferase [Limnobacter sp.]
MLVTRVITALVLLAVLGSVLLWGGDQGWLAFVAVVLFASFWEWARLGLFSNQSALLYAALGTALYLLIELATSGSAIVFPFLALSGVFWVAFAPWCLMQVSIGLLQSRNWYFLTGLVLMPAAGLALTSAHKQGFVFLLSVIAICWVADIFAYVFGKLFGKRKLAPKISPGKSWEGAVGGTLTVVALSWLVILLANHLPVFKQSWQYQAYEQWPAVLFTLWIVALSAISIAGDLFESLLKRRADMKDSSSLLPGHGGVLDRIDAQLPVLPLAMLLLGAAGTV